MKLDTLALAIAFALATLLTLGVAHAQDEALQKMIGIWKGTIERFDESERMLVIKSVTRAADIWIASVEYGPTGQKLDAFSARVEKRRGATNLSFQTSTTRKVELSLVSDTELRGSLKVSDREGSWVVRKMVLRKTGDKP
jgi:hypothetical protein